jgi:hypothetical protein
MEDANWRLVLHHRPMLPRIRELLLGFGVLELALLVAILVSIARFKGITIARQVMAPADTSLCRGSDCTKVTDKGRTH